MWAALGLTLIVGTGLGVALDRLLLEREGYHEKTIASNRGRAHAFWSESRAAFDTLRQEFRQEIRVLLNPEQQKIFDEMVAREAEKRKRRHQER